MTRVPLDETAIAELARVAEATKSGGLTTWANGAFFAPGMPLATFSALTARGLINVVDGRVVIAAKGVEYLEWLAAE
jgi:hypothetical protein